MSAEARAEAAEARVAALETENAELQAMVAKLTAQLGVVGDAPSAASPEPEEAEPPTAKDEGAEAREAMLNYWESQSGGDGMLGPTVEAMMLDEGAAKIDQAERPEILGMLPPLEGMDMIEMGAGIGRLTGELATRAKTVLACDFVDVSIKANEAAHSHLGNCEFLCADATKMDRPAGSLDIVFSNWLLMYFTDAEVDELFAKALRWLRPGGYLFFRESCFHQSGNAKRNENPTEYRSPGQYHQMATDQLQLLTPDGPPASPSRRVKQQLQSGGGCYVFELVTQKALQSYIELKGNHNQIAWLFQKRETTFTRAPTRGAVIQTFLDSQRYTTEAIRIYERMYGEGYVSCGGADTTTELVTSLALQPGERVLDVGCGIGGGWQQNAYDYQVKVVGVDLSVNMINLALDRRVRVAKHQDVEQRKLCDVSFEVADIMEREFDDASFDVIYARDSLLHIDDKEALFGRLFRWLKPGGRLLLSDYVVADPKDVPQLSAEFSGYISSRSYSLLDTAKYSSTIAAAGFSDLAVEDRTEQMVTCLNKELSAIREPATAEAFERDFGAGDLQQLTDGWEGKLKWAADGEFKWAVIRATKPKE
jgi:phosphoethanolamine N-methyltransferase